jgi:hypothetical protein
MPLDRALRATVRNFSTLFLLAAIFTVPLHVGHAYAFRRVIAVSDLHPAIERFPKARQVRGVGPGAVARARMGYLVLNLLEVALLPLLARPAARIMAADRRREVPTVIGALAAGKRSNDAISWRGLAMGPLVVALLLAAVIAWLARTVGLVLVEPLPSASAFAGVGLVEGLSRALGAPFVLGVAGWMATQDTGRAPRGRTKDT